MTTTSTRMSAVDTAWLRMDSPDNLMSIVGVWTLQPALDLRALRRRLHERLLCHARFRQKVVRDTLGATWVDDDDFDLARHLRREPLPRRRGQTDEAALQARVGELAAQPFDPDHPLWQVHLLRYQGGSALIIRLHHCLADGVALFALLASLCDGGPELGPDPAADTPAAAPGLLAELVAPLRAAASQAAAEPGQALQRGARALRDAFTLVTQANDSATRLKGPLCGVKLATWAEPLPLAQVKAVSRALGASVNDLMLACAAGALGAWLRELGDNPTGQHIRAMVPVNLRALEDAWQLGNCFGLAPVLLPIGVDDIPARVAEVHQRMQEMKDGFKPRMAYDMLRLSGRSLQLGRDLVSRAATDKSTAVMTNMAGPTTPVQLCGSEVLRYVFWVPSSGDVGVGASIVSYDGNVLFGLITDRARCAEPGRVVALFADEFDAAARAAGLRATRPR
jgi:diacylglycerol O-acyltransferase / wax synthase